MKENSTTQDPLLLTAREAASAIRLSERLLWTLTNNGTIPCVRIGRAVRYDVADLRAFIEAHKQLTPPVKVQSVNGPKLSLVICDDSDR